MTNQKQVRIVTQFTNGTVSDGILIKRIDQKTSHACWLWIRKCGDAGIYIDHIGYGKDQIYSVPAWLEKPNTAFKALMNKIFNE